MAGQVDGGVVVDTTLQTEGFEKGSKEMQRAIDSLRKKVDGLAPTMKKAVQGSASALQSFDGKVEPLQEDIAKIEKKMASLGQMRIPTEDYAWLQKNLKEAETNLGKLLDKQVVMEDMGVDKSSKAWQRLQSEINLTNRQIADYKDEMQWMENEGTAFIDGKNASGYSQLQEAFSGATEKLGEMTQQAQKCREELQTKAFEKTNQQLQLSISQLQRKVNSLTPAMQKAMRGSASALDTFDGKAQMLQETIRRIKEQMAAMAKMKVPQAGKEPVDGADTSEYEELEKALNSVTDKLDTMMQKVEKSQTAWSKFSNVLRNGAVKGLKSLVSNVTKGAAAMLGLSLRANKTHSSFNNGLKSLLRYGVGVRSLFALMNKLRSALANGYKNLVQYSDRTNTAISSIRSALTRLENSLATAFNPIVTAAAPALVQLINLISEAVSRIGMLTAALTGAKTFTKAKTIQEDYAKSLDKTSKSADKTKKALAGFDELNILDDKSTDKDDGSVDPSQMFEQVPIDSSIGDFAQRLKDAFEAGDWEGLGTLLGDKINSLVESVDWEAWGKRLGKGLNAAIQTLYYTIDTVNWVKIGNHLGEAVNGIIGEVDWDKFGRLLAKRFTVVLDVVGGFLEELDWTKALNAFIRSFTGFFDELKDWLESKDWKEIGQTVTAKLSDALQNADIGETTRAFSQFIATAITSVASFLDGVDFAQVVLDIIGFFVSAVSGVDWAALAEAFGYALGVAIKKSVEFLADIAEYVVSAIVGYFKTKIDEGPFENIGANFIYGILKGIEDVLEGIVGWIYNNIFKPIWDGICEAFGIHSPSKKMMEIGGYIVEGLIEGIKELPGKLKDKFDEAVERAKEFATAIVSKVKNGVGDAVTQAVDKIKSFPGNVKKKFDDTVDNVRTFATNFRDKLKAAASDAVEKAVDKVKSLPTDFKKKFDDTLEKAREFASELKDKVKEGTEKAVSEATEKIKSLPGKLREKFDSAVTNAEKFASSIISKVGGGVKNAVSDAGKEITSLPTKIKEKLDTVITNVTSWASTLVSKFKDAGRYALEGIITGISEKMEAVKTAISSVGTALINTFKDLLGIHSPSTVFKDLAGFIAAGLTEGLNGSHEDVEEAAKKLGEAAVGAAEEAIEGVGETTIQRIKDNLSQIEDAFSDDTGLGKLSNLVNDMFSVDWKDISIDDITGLAGDVSKLLFDSLDTDVREAASNFAVTSLGYLNKAYEEKGLAGMADAAKSIVSSLSKNLGANMGGLVKQGTTIISQLKNGVLSALGACNIKLIAIVGVVALIAAAIVGAWKNSEDFRNAVISALNLIKTTVANVINAAKQAVTPLINLVQKALSNAQDLLRRLFDFIGQIFAQVIQWVTPVISIIGQFLEDVFGVIGQIATYISSILEPIIDGLYSVMCTIFDVLADIWQDVSAALTPAFNAIWEVVSNILQTVTDLLSALVTALKPAVDALASAFGKIFELISKVISAVAEALSPVISVIANVFGTILTVIVQIVNVMVQALAPVIQLIGQVLGTIFTVVGGIVSAVVDFLEPVIDVICKAIAGIADILKNIANVFVIVINGMISGVEDFINFFIAGINAIIQALNKISIDIPKWIPGIGGQKFGFNLSEIQEVSFDRIKEFSDDDTTKDTSKTKTSSTSSTSTESAVDKALAAIKEQDDSATEKQNSILENIMSSLKEITKQSDYTTPTVASGSTTPYSVAASAAENEALMSKMSDQMEYSHDKLSQVIVQAIGSATNSICAAVEQYSGAEVNLDADSIAQYTVKYINQKTRMFGSSPLLNPKEV